MSRLFLLMLCCSLPAFASRKILVPSLPIGGNFPYNSAAGTLTGILFEYNVLLRNVGTQVQHGKVTIDPGLVENAGLWTSGIAVGKVFYGCGAPSASGGFTTNNSFPSNAELPFTVTAGASATVKLGGFYYVALPTSPNGIGINLSLPLTIHVDEDRGAMIAVVKTYFLCPTPGGTLCSGGALNPWTGGCPVIPAGDSAPVLLQSGRPF